RIEIAREAEHRFRRKVAWGARCAEHSEMFTTLSIPVMTRLRQPERRVLDTLVDAGVARSRSDALAWCVRLTGEHADSWLTGRRAALRGVGEVRPRGPPFNPPPPYPSASAHRRGPIPPIAPLVGYRD